MVLHVKLNPRVDCLKVTDWVLVLLHLYVAVEVDGDVIGVVDDRASVASVLITPRVCTVWVKHTLARPVTLKPEQWERDSVTDTFVRAKLVGSWDDSIPVGTVKQLLRESRVLHNRIGHEGIERYLLNPLVDCSDTAVVLCA